MKGVLNKLSFGGSKKVGASAREQADAFRDAGAWADAAKCYAEYLEDNPDDVAILVQSGHALKECGRREEALAAYDRAASRAPQDDDVHLSRGHVLKLLGRLSEATRAYRTALELSPDNASALRELVELSPGAVGSTTTAGFDNLRRKRWLLLDVTDILQYARVNVSLSGIQRVVSTLIQHAQAWTNRNADWAVVLVSTDFVRRDTLALSASIMGEMLATIEAGSFTRSMLDRYLDGLDNTRFRIEPRKGDVLTMAGAFWIYRQYDYLIELKRNGVGYCLFIHDLLQITHPEYVESAATNVFRTSIIDVLTVVDFVLTNSEYVADDVRRYLSTRLNFVVPVSAVLLPTELPPHVKHGSISEELRTVAKKSFALSVGTIEIRKNHFLLIRIWEELLRKRVPNIPDLVFVGKWGWQIDELRHYLNRSDYLQGKLHIFTGISDTELDFLYEHCAFTLYPSFAEGFGLPVGESLGFGKPCIASSSTSIPEVGGRFARYMDPTSVAQGVKLVTEIITDPKGLAAWTADIRANYVAKTREAFADEFFDTVRTKSQPLTAQQRSNCQLPAGKVIFGGNDDVHRLDALGRALVTFRMARTLGWHPMEGWGSWARSRRAHLDFQTELDERAEVTVFVKIKGPPNSSNLGVRFFVGGVENEVVELDDQPRWRVISGVVSESGLVTIELLARGEFARMDDRETYVGLSAMAYAASKDILNRMNVLEAIATGA